MRPKAIGTVLAFLAAAALSAAQVRNSPPKAQAPACVDQIADAIDGMSVVLSLTGRQIPIQIEAKNLADETVAAEVIKTLFADWFTLTSSPSAPKLSVHETTREVGAQVIGSLQVEVVLPMVETFRIGQERHVVALWMGAAQESGLIYYGPNDYDYRRQAVHDFIYKVLSTFRDNVTHDAPSK